MQNIVGIERLTAAVLVSLMILITFIDIKHRIIPNGWVALGLFSGSVLGLLRPGAGVWFMLTGLLTGFGLLLLTFVLSRGQLGLGDVKMGAVMGVYLGWQGTLLALFLAFLTGAGFGIFLILGRGKNRSSTLPFGPFLAASTVLSFYWADSIFLGYLNAFG